MKNFLIASATVATLFLTTPAFATATCGNAAQTAWMSVEAITAKAVEMGYEVKNVKIEDGCFEVYGIKDGNKVEAYLNPVTAEVVKVKTK